MLGGRGGVLIHRALHRRIGGEWPRVTVYPVASVVDRVRMLQGVGEPVCHAYLLWHRVHDALGAVEVPRTLLVLPLGLCDLYLPRLRLFQDGLASSGRHHLECDDRRQLLPAHGDIHGGEHGTLAVVLAHAGVGSPHLVRYEAKHVATVAVFGHANPALLLSEHVADGRQQRSGGGAAEEWGGVCRAGDGAGHITRVGVW